MKVSPAVAPAGRPRQEAPRSSRLLPSTLPGTYLSSKSRASAVEAHGPKTAALDPLSGVRDMLSGCTDQSRPIFPRPSLPGPFPSPSSSGRPLPP